LNEITFNNIRKCFFKKRYIFIDEENIYYFWQIYFSEFGSTLEIVPFKYDGKKFVEIKTSKVELLIDYLKFMLIDKNPKEIRKFFNYLQSLKFSLSDIQREKLGDNFCRFFIRDRDDKFIFLDTYAKHWIIDFKKIKNRDKHILKEPKIFPFYIPEVKVTITEDAKILKNDQEINIDNFWEIYEEYKKSLIPLIKKKDQIFRKIEEDLKVRFYKTQKQLKNSKIFDYEIDAVIYVYDGLLNYEDILRISYSQYSFEDNYQYDLHFYGFDMKVSSLMWNLIDNFGIRIIPTKLSFWSEIETKNQKSFKI
jgi:hypothetical protein